MKIDGIDYGDTAQVSRNTNSNQLFTLLSMLFLATQACARPVARQAAEELEYSPKKDPNMPNPDFSFPPGSDWFCDDYPISITNPNLGLVVAGEHRACYQMDSKSGYSVAISFNYDEFQKDLEQSIGYNSSTTLVDYSAKPTNIDIFDPLVEYQFNCAVWGLTPEDAQKFTKAYHQTVDDVQQDRLKDLALGVIFIVVGLAAAALVVGCGYLVARRFCYNDSSERRTHTPLRNSQHMRAPLIDDGRSNAPANPGDKNYNAAAYRGINN